MTDIPPPTLRAVAGGEAPSLAGVTPPGGASGRRLTEVLAELGFVSPERIESAVQTGRATGAPPERVLLEQGAIDPEQLARAIAARYGLDHLDLDVFAVDWSAARLLAASVATRLQAVPVAFVDDHTLLVAIADPAAAAALDDIATRTRLEVRPAVASAEAIAAIVARADDDEPAPAPVLELREPGVDAAATELARSLIADAGGRGATAIHLEPEAGGLRARARVAGALGPPRAVTGALAESLVAAFKDMVGLDRPETARPQRGWGRVTVRGTTFELTVNSLPGAAGESAVVRLHDPAARVPGLDELGLRTDVLDRALALGRGAVLVAGATAAARATALRSLAAAAGTPRRRLVVVEDDVRAALEADADVLVFEALRDRETASAALEAALDGLLVLAAVPAPDADGARRRLAGMGVEPFLLEHAIACSVTARPEPPRPR